MIEDFFLLDGLGFTLDPKKYYRMCHSKVILHISCNTIEFYKLSTSYLLDAPL